MNIHFQLVPDRSSARRLRRLVAQKGGRLGVIIGTWPELLEQARKSYLLPQPEDWDEKLAEAARSMKDAFWAKSCEVAPYETIAEISRALSMLIEGRGPDKHVESDKKGLPERAGRHLTDLSELHKNIGFILPPHLATIDGVLKAEPATVLRNITVYHAPGFPDLSPWQKALVKKLNGDSGVAARDKALEDLLLASLEWKGAPNKSALAALQTGLFDTTAKPVKLDNTIQWLACRDFLEEAEIAAGIIQTALKEDKKLNISDFGILVPSERVYEDAVRDAFTLAGIPVSGLNIGRKVRDLGREAVFNFLITRRRPAPAMALASLYSNPLMPWTGIDGADLAQEIMDGTFDPRLPHDSSRDAHRMIDLIQQDTSTPSELGKSLRNFVSLLYSNERLVEHVRRAQELLDELEVTLLSAGEIPWKELLALSAPSNVVTHLDEIMSREGVAVFSENEEPWREVKILIVFGFSSGRYPTPASSSPVFFESDMVQLKEKLGYDVQTGIDMVSRKRLLFRRQLSSAAHAITFLIPRRDPQGEVIHPSETLPFMARLISPTKGNKEITADDLIFELDTEEGRTNARWLALAKPAKPTAAWTPVIADLNLKRNLLTIRVDDAGAPKPESPSVLETLMVSPFAWLLVRAGFEAREWVREDLDVSLKGILAHEILEYFFNENRPIPTPSAIRKETPTQFMNAIRNIAPFLQEMEWSVERKHLEKEILDAALWWRERLIQIGAKVLGAETWLNGIFDGVPIHGKTDLLVEVSAGQLFIVDYKKSSSAKYRTMMQAGYASQVALYRIMLQTGKYPEDTNKALATALREKRNMGVLYALLNDHKVLTDSSGLLGTSLQDVTEMGQGIAEKGLDLIKERFKDLRNGIIKLNSETDEDWFADNTGVTATYALDKSPLVRLFMRPAECEGEVKE